MKKTVIMTLSVLLIFFLIIEFEPSLRKRAYVDTFASFHIDKNLKKDVYKIENDKYDIYKIVLDKKDFKVLTETLKSEEFVLNYDMKVLKSKEFFSGLNSLLNKDEQFKEVKDNRPEIYVIYNSDDNMLTADVIISTAQLNQCCLFVNYR